MEGMKGQAFLSLVIFIGSITLLIGVTLVFLTNSFIDTGYGYQASVQAEAVASSGAADGLLQLARNCAFSNTTGYGVPVGPNAATVTVTQGSPTCSGTVTILSTATVLNRTRKVSVAAAVNASTTQVSVISWQAIQ